MKTWAAVVLLMLSAGRMVVAQEVALSLSEEPRSASSSTFTANGDPGAGAAGGPFAAPAAQKVDVTETDTLRWQLAIGPTFVRFHNRIFNADMAGTITSLAWSRNEWLSFEGQVVTGFAPEIYTREHVKYVSYGGGVKIGSHRAKWEPFAHALIGGAHQQPQTAGNSRNAFMIQAGGGVDYRLWPKMSLRAEADYLHTNFFKTSQNNFQASIGAVFHF
jgi:opacity protein-like surface antigen